MKSEGEEFWSGGVVERGSAGGGVQKTGHRGNRECYVVLSEMGDRRPQDCAFLVFILVLILVLCGAGH